MDIKKLRIKRIVLIVLLVFVTFFAIFFLYENIASKRVEMNSDISELLGKTINEVLTLDGAVLLAEEKVNAQDSNQESANVYEIAIVNNEEGVGQGETRFQFVQ